MGNRQTGVYYVQRTRSDLPAAQNRIYFRTVADARAAGYQPARARAIPIDPRLTWRNKHGLPSLGTQHQPPPPPRGIQKPAAPPQAQQPPVAPTQPMPN